ncbi:M28 family peptidase [bacterium]|nr:M28 family peptidase [FCB group bacterium]MBL7190755.1 M28 family peptidase [bacterium]
MLRLTSQIIVFILFISAVTISSLRAEVPVFNSESAWNYLLAQCEFGPRNPGSEGHVKCRDYLKDELLKFTGRVRLQPFTFYDSRLRKNFDMYNIIADFGSETGAKIILCAHWDTRPRSDCDPDPAKRHLPILGANDGASGVAVLLEMARMFAVNPPPVPVQIIFFDGEDYGREGEIWDYLLGSKHFAKTIDARDYRYAVLLDLIGDEDLEIKKEYHSYQYSPDLMERIWKIARRLGIDQFSSRIQLPVIDDHISLIEIGIPAVDLIDFEYRYWHTQEDTPEHCRQESLEAVGRVLTELIYTEED